MSHSADRPLLLGLLALQTGRIRLDQLVSALQIWAADKDKPFDQCLTTMGQLDETQMEELGTVADLHVAAHEGEIEKSLGSIVIDEATRAELTATATATADADLAAALARVGQQNPNDDDASRSSGSSPFTWFGKRSADGPGASTDQLRSQTLGATSQSGSFRIASLESRLGIRVSPRRPVLGPPVAPLRKPRGFELGF